MGFLQIHSAFWILSPAQFCQTNQRSQNATKITWTEQPKIASLQAGQQYDTLPGQQNEYSMC